MIYFSIDSSIFAPINKPVQHFYKFSAILYQMALTNQQKYLVTAALPYANGYLHIGHLLEHVQADIYSRFLKLEGKDTLFICGADMHGTPVEVNAAKAGKKPEEFATFFLQEQKKDFESFLINYDNYYTTHSKENKKLALMFFKQLKEKGLITTKEMEQMYDPKAKRFLPDRYIKGTCPKCKAEDQYGDICEKCGSTYSPSDLIKPYSTLSKATPELRKTTHYFFSLSKLSEKLKKWLNSNDGIQKEIKNWLNNWLKEGLRDWCISRDKPYFGFEIPNSKKETGATKFFYVWLDAPIGYISSTQNYCDKLAGKSKKCDWKDYWYKGNVHHVIGKDIVYFHYLFWPAMLMSLDIPVPQLTTHGFITVNGEKMSKSRGTFFTIRDFRKLYHPEALRFFYASHIDRKVIDIDLNLDDFKAVTNNVLMGNLGNFCFRTLVFAEKNYGVIKEVADEKKLIKQIESLTASVQKDYADLDFKSAVKKILQISDLGNAYFQQSEPWKNKEDPKIKEAVGLCVNIARNLSILVQPILPEFSVKVQKALGEKDLHLNDINFEWKGKLKKVEKLVEKIDELPNLAGGSAGSSDSAGNVSSEQTGSSLHLKVGKVIEVNDHPNADSLYLLKVDFGDEKRQVVAGLKKHFSVDDLLNRKTVFCVNLKKAKLRGEWSEAMILIAEEKEAKSEKGGKLFFLDSTGKVGSNVLSGSKEISFDDFLKVKFSIKQGKVLVNGEILPNVTTKAKDGAKVS